MTSPSCYFLKTTLFVQPADFGVDNRDAAAFRRGERVIHLVDEVFRLLLGDGLRRRTLQIEADGNLLARLFDNLINNAIKYGADGKKIVVSVEREDPMVVIRVLNYGKIIPPEELDHIFEKFY